MSTSDVPGANPVNGDDLHAGCWAEHSDGSLLFVEGAEGGRVIYSMFDMSKEPIVEYRDSMVRKAFDDAFTKAGWTWHDKTPFDWDRVIKAGAKDGSRYAHADAHITEAERIAASRNARRSEFDQERWEHMLEKAGRRGRVIIDKMQRAIRELGR